MGKLLIGFLGLVVGVIGGVVLGGGAMTGIAAGAGVATGLSAGICATVEAAAAEGLLTDDEIGRIMARATTDLGGTVPAEAELAGTRAQCDGVMAKLRETAES